MLEKFLVYWIPKTMVGKRKEGWPEEKLVEEVMVTLMKIYTRSIGEFGYDFVLRKRTLRRLRGVMAVHLKAADEVF